MASVIRVVVVDDEPAYRSALQRTLNLAPDIELVGLAKDGVEALAMVDELKPDVVLTDINMPHVDGVELTQRLTESHPDVKMVILTVNEEDDVIFDAFRYGALGYLLKTSTPQDVIDSIRLAKQGEAKITPKIASRLLADYRSDNRSSSSNQGQGGGNLFALSERESQILDLVAEGLRNKEIAERLGITEKTVKNHVSNILKALQVDSRTEAAMKAVRARAKDADAEI